MSGHLSYSCISVISDQFNHSHLTSGMNKAFSPPNCHSLDILTPEMLVCENPSKVVFEMTDQPIWRHQPRHIQSHINPLSSPF